MAEWGVLAVVIKALERLWSWAGGWRARARRERREVLTAMILRQFERASRRTVTEMCVAFARTIAQDLGRPLGEVTEVLAEMVAEGRLFYEPINHGYSNQPTPWTRSSGRGLFGEMYGSQPAACELA